MCDVKVNGQKSLVDSILMVLAQDALVPPPKARLVRIWTFVKMGSKMNRSDDACGALIQR